MKKLLSSLLNRLTMYQTMLWFLRVLLLAAVGLSFFGVLPYTWWHIVINLFIFFGFCVGFNEIFARLYKVKPNFESKYITAEILTLIVGPLNPFTGWWIMGVISLLAMGSKYVFVYRNRHIFNPAAFGVLVTALIFEQGASWWVGGKFMLPFVLVGGFLMLFKLRWFHLAISYLLTYILALGLTLYTQGNSFEIIFNAIKSTLLDSGLIYFTAVMLIEPLTAPSSRQNRIYFGMAVAVLMVMIPFIWPSYGYAIETALLAGNFLTLIFAPKSARQNMVLVDKKTEAKDTVSFWFKPTNKFKFTAGQFLEWSLVHPKADSRGVRRFFTIASSPSQDQVRLVTKFAEKSSSYKTALNALKLGEEIVISEQGGEFILPKNEKQKFIFIAGGVGITPFLSMLQDLIDTNKNRDIVLFYANKTSAEIGFKDLFERAKNIGLQKTILLVDKPEPGWTGKTGFITAEMIKQEAPDWKERMFYVSGPEPMVMAYEKMLKQMGIKNNMIIRDYFPGYNA